MDLKESEDSELKLGLSAPKFNGNKAKKCTKNKLIISGVSVAVISVIVILLVVLLKKKSDDIPVDAYGGLSNN